MPLERTPSLPDQTAARRHKLRRDAARRRRALAVLLLVVIVALAVGIPLACSSKDSEGEARTTITNIPGSLASSSTSLAEGTNPTPTTAIPLTPDAARTLKANEMGLIPILMYHAIKASIVPPQRLREDIAALKKAGFYPTTIRDMAESRMDIPAGKSPVVLSFDDSSPTHYRILEDGGIDPDCVVSILRNAAQAGDWAAKATFFPLLCVDPPANIVFRQPEYAEQKLQNLVKWGFEIGSHTM